MEEKRTLVVTAIPNPNEIESVQQYLQGVLPLLMGAGGKPVKRLKVDQVIHGKPSRMVLVFAVRQLRSRTSPSDFVDHSPDSTCQIASHDSTSYRSVIGKPGGRSSSSRRSN